MKNIQATKITPDDPTICPVFVYSFFMLVIYAFCIKAYDIACGSIYFIIVINFAGDEFYLVYLSLIHI